MSRKPDFFIVGAPKSGTSSLYNYLGQHPDVLLSEPKEPHFFHNRHSPGSPVLGEKDLDGYLRLFQDAPDGARVGEASTSYLWSANAAAEIKSFRPEAKIVAVLRNPVGRAYSQYWNHVRDGIEPLTFEGALEAEPERKEAGRWCGFYYVDAGRYAEQVARYLDVFGRDAVKIYLFEDLKEDAEGVCRDVFSFLGVDAGVPLEASKVYNRSGPPRSPRLSGALYRLSRRKRLTAAMPVALRRGVKEWFSTKNVKPTPPMDPGTRARLRETYAGDVRRLQELIGRDLGRWLE